MNEKIIEKVVEVPALALDRTILTGKQITETITNHGHLQKANKYWKTLGPGLTTGAADDDPSGIATYSQTGAKFGFQLLWLSLFTFPLMAIVQEMCARIGLVTGRGLAANIRLNYPKFILYICTILLFSANTINLGADLGAMAKATKLILPPEISYNLVIIGFAILCLGLQIFINYGDYAKYLKWLALILLSYVFSALSMKLDWNQVFFHTVMPSLTFSKENIFIICAILGTTISPYLFFWQTSQEVEERILEGKTTVKLRQVEVTNDEINNMKIDIWSGMFLSNLVMFFIITTCAATLYTNGITNIDTAEQAAEALRPLAGDFTYILFTLGIVGSGMLAVPVLAGSASYALSESLGWKYGLYRKLKEASAFYGAIMISTIIGLAINFLGIDPIKALLYSAVVNGLIAPIILVLILLISSNKKIMGARANHPVTSFLGWFITIIMIVVAVLTIISLLIK